MGLAPQIDAVIRQSVPHGKGARYRISTNTTTNTVMNSRLQGRRSAASFDSRSSKPRVGRRQARGTITRSGAVSGRPVAAGREDAEQAAGNVRDQTPSPEFTTRQLAKRCFPYRPLRGCD